MSYEHFLLVLVYVGDSRASAVSHSLSSSNQFLSANINHPDFIYSASFYSGDRLHRERRSSKKQPGYPSGNKIKTIILLFYAQLSFISIIKCTKY